MDSFRMVRPKPTGPVLSGLYTCALFEERSMVEDVEINRLYWHSRRDAKPLLKSMPRPASCSTRTPLSV